VYAIGIPGAILLCLGVPVSTLAIMLSIRKRLRQPRTTATFGFLYHQFKCARGRLAWDHFLQFLPWPWREGWPCSWPPSRFWTRP
jgi:hypothetical protein